VATDPGLVAINAADGSKRWANEEGGRPRTPTVAADVVVATTDQRLYAVNRIEGFD
jgi:hypothetical protein